MPKITAGSFADPLAHFNNANSWANLALGLCGAGVEEIIIILGKAAVSFAASKALGTSFGDGDRPPSMTQIQGAIDRAVVELERFFITTLNAALVEQKRRDLTALARGVQDNLQLYLGGPRPPNAAYANLIPVANRDSAVGKEDAAQYCPQMSGLFVLFVTLRIYCQVSTYFISNYNRDVLRTYAPELVTDANNLLAFVNTNIDTLNPDVRINGSIGCSAPGDTSGALHTVGQVCCWFEQDGLTLPKNRSCDWFTGNAAVFDDLKRDLRNNIMPARRLELQQFQSKVEAEWAAPYRELASRWLELARQFS